MPVMLVPEKWEFRLHYVLGMLRGARFRCANEAELQAQVERLLVDRGLEFEREKVLSARDRLDFLVSPGVALELKVKTDGKSLLRQVLRYAEHEAVNAIVVGSTTHHALRIPNKAKGKPVHVVHLLTGF